MKNVLLGFATAIVIACAAFLFLQHQAQQKLRADNEALAQQLAQLQADNESISNRLTTAGDSQKLSVEQFNELLKLRGEVGVLRNQAGEIGKLRDENRQLQKQTTVGQNQTVQISPEDQFKLQEFHTIDTMKRIGLAMRIYSGDHNDMLVTNFDQIIKAKLYETNNYPDRIGLDNFEFENIGLLNYDHPEMIMFREKAARQILGGRWEREYGLVDGSVQTIYSDDGNFDDYEKEHSPPPNQ